LTGRFAKVTEQDGDIVRDPQTSFLYSGECFRMNSPLSSVGTIFLTAASDIPRVMPFTSNLLRKAVGASGDPIWGFGVVLGLSLHPESISSDKRTI
jgi:hypothetical protein